MRKRTISSLLSVKKFNNNKITATAFTKLNSLLPSIYYCQQPQLQNFHQNQFSLFNSTIFNSNNNLNNNNNPSIKNVRVLVLFYSTYGHIYQMAKEVAEGAKEVEGAEVIIKRVPETLPTEILEKMGAIQAQQAFAEVPIATPNELKDYDVIIFGTPTRFGNMAGQMKSFIDGLGQLWVSGALIGKVASVFVSSGTQHGGQESTILSFIPTLLHLGFVYSGLPYSCQSQMGIDEIKGGSPYGSSTIVGGKGERLPSEQERGMARFQGKHATTIGKKLIQ
ncbi:hypothetical protein ABK040_009980 [Willaertia magna]